MKRNINKFMSMLAVFSVALIGLMFISASPASARAVRWSDVYTTHQGVAHGYTVGIQTCNPHSAGQGQGVTFHHRGNAEQLFADLTKYGARHPGIYRKLILFRGSSHRVFASVPFRCYGLDGSVHS